MAEQVEEAKTIDYSDSSLGELGEAIQGAAYALGVSAGYQQASAKLRRWSGDYYAHGGDAMARACRKLANDVEEEADEARATYDTYSSPRERAAFAELEKRDGATG